MGTKNGNNFKSKMTNFKYMYCAINVYNPMLHSNFQSSVQLKINVPSLPVLHRVRRVHSPGAFRLINKSVRSTKTTNTSYIWDCDGIRQIESSCQSCSSCLACSARHIMQFMDGNLQYNTIQYNEHFVEE